MKRIELVLVVVIMVAMMVTACAPTRTLTISRVQKNAGSMSQPVTGMVPVHIENPDLLPQEVCLFEGSTRVDVIPDAKKGGWMYSRPAFACYRIEGANSENNWHEYSQVMLPRNMSFVAVARVNGILGQGRPYFRHFRTGSDPFAVRYWSVTPTPRPVDCGALVRLHQQPSSVQPMNIRVDIDTRPIGVAITNKLTEAVYGR